MGLDSAYQMEEAKKQAAKAGVAPPSMQAIKAVQAARLTAEEQEWRRRYAMRESADPALRRGGSAGGNALRLTATLGGDTVGAMFGDPTSFLAPGRQLATKLIGQALLGGAGDLGLQELERREGTREGWDPTQTMISTVSGPIAILGAREIGRRAPDFFARARRYRGSGLFGRRSPPPQPLHQPPRLQDIDPARISYGHDLETAGLVLVDGKPWKMPDGKYGSVAFRVPLSAEQLAKSGKTHHRVASMAYKSALDAADPAERASVEAMMPGVFDALSARTPRSPANWTWDHDWDDAAMQLVPKWQHKARAFQETFHPDGTGGYARKAVPAGAPPRHRRKKR